MRIKRLLLLLTAVLGALMILGWSQTWFSVGLADGQELEVPGSSAGAAVLATGLALLAVAAALTIARRILRWVLGAITALVGAVAVFAAVGAVSDPVGAASGTVTEQTGVSGRESVAALIGSIAVQPWPYLVVVAGVLALLTGVGVLVTARRWPDPGARYDRAPVQRPDWDALTEGDDPTR